MTAKKKGKKLLLSVTAIILVAALGAGIWLVARGGGDPVAVYPFGYIGMTEFWGDSQESYGPVTADGIQSEFLTDTQTVIEVKVKKGDSVKKGDVLFTFDTTLDALSLERKRLELEKIKVQIDAAGERLQETREMVPYVPPKPTEPDEEDLGKELTQPYVISNETGEDAKIYDGTSKEKAIICWIKDVSSITDEMLKALLKAADSYQDGNVSTDDDTSTDEDTDEIPEDGADKNESSASAIPERWLDDQGSTDPTEGPEDKYRVPGFFTCNGEEVKADNMTVTEEGYLISDSYTYQGKTYWIKSATRKKDGMLLEDLNIDAYPQTREEQLKWEALWGEGVEVEYIRKVDITGSELKDNKFIPFEENASITVELGKNVVLMFNPQIIDLPQVPRLEFEVTPADGILVPAYKEGYLILSGQPEMITDQAIPYTVTAKYIFENNSEQDRAVDSSVSFTLSVVPEPEVKSGEFYVVFKSTKENRQKAARTFWQGAKVTAYENGTFDVLLYNPEEGFEDHTIKKEEIEIDLPDIDPNAIYTAEQILEMQKQLYAIIKEQNEALKMAESEYAIMERELGDGNVRAEVDGKVVSVLTEEQAKDEYLPLVKVSGGGGYYIEGSVSELDKETLQLGQEVSVNDWNSGEFYTGEVVSIGDFPSDRTNWNGMGNPTVSYYPFRVFVAEDADLQTGSYVSMSYSTNTAEQGVYLEKAFVRMEKGNAYVYVQGANGRLEKRRVRLGKVLWGNYYEILSGLSEEEYVAFPYGKNVKHGAPTVEGDLSALYSY